MSALNLHILLNMNEWGFAFVLVNVDDLFRLLVDNLLIVPQGCNPCSGSSKKLLTLTSFLTPNLCEALSVVL